MITLHNGYQIDANNITIYSTMISFYTVVSDINELRNQLVSADNLSEIDIDGTIYYDYTKVNTFETQLNGNPLDTSESILFTVRVEVRSQTVNDAIADMKEQVASITDALNKSVQTVSSLQEIVNAQSKTIQELRENIAATVQEEVTTNEE